MAFILAIVGPALLVAPLAGLDPGIQPALKLVWLAAVTLAIVARAAPLPRATPCELALAALAGSAALSVAIAGADAGSAIPVVASLACLALLARGARAQAAGWDRVETAAIVAAAAVAAIAVAELLGAHLPWSYHRRPESTLGNRNEVAMYLALAAPIVAGAAARGRRGAAACLTLVVAVIVASHCRGAYLAVCAAAASALVQRARPRRVAVVLVAGGLGIALGAAPWPGVRFAASVEDSASRMLEIAHGLGAARLRQHELGLRALADRPAAAVAGYGAGTWESVASAHAHDVGDPVPRVTGATVPNSELLRLAVEQGLLGVALAIAAVVLALRTQRPAGRAVLIAACVAGIVDPVVVRAECIALLAVVIGVGDTGRPISGGRGRAILLGLAGLALGLAAARAGSFVAAAAGDPALAGCLVPRPGLDERAALALAGRGDCAPAERALDRFLARRPAHWGARAAVARCFARAGLHRDATRIWAEALAVEPLLHERIEHAGE